jgi:hypothetical protein
MKHRIRTIALVASHGEVDALVKEVKDRFYSNQVSLVLRRDLQQRWTVSEPGIPITLRPIEAADFKPIIKERPRRLPVLLANIPTCYVAVTRSNEIAFMVWIVCSEDWPRFKQHFKGDLPRELHHDECIVEFSYTFEKFRRQGIMATSLNLIAERIAKERPSIRWAYTYVHQDNIPSIKGCKSAGFLPYMIREEQWRAFRLHQQFNPLRPETAFPLERTVSGANRVV